MKTENQTKNIIKFKYELQTNLKKYFLGHMINDQLKYNIKYMVWHLYNEWAIMMGSPRMITFEEVRIEPELGYGSTVNIKLPEDITKFLQGE